VKEGYERRRFTKERGGSFYLFLGGIIFGGFSWICAGELSSVVGKD
jgi:hypothetical protein